MAAVTNYNNLPPRLIPSSSFEMGIALVVGIAGGVLIYLSMHRFFGPLGTLGFKASFAGGATLVVISVGAIAFIGTRRHQPPDFNQPIDVPTIPAGYAEEGQRYLASREEFRKRAMENFRGESKPDFVMPNITSGPAQEFVQDALMASNPYGKSYLTFTGGGATDVRITERLPQVVFKKPGTFGFKHVYVERNERARQICKEYNLHLLYVPKAHYVDETQEWVMEERCDLLEGGWNGQKAGYEWLTHEPALQEYGKELFRQLTIFICRMGLSDVKYDNVPLMKDGRVALIDLDESGPITGLTRGCAGGGHGLFSMLPIEWFDEMQSLALSHGGVLRYGYIRTAWIPELREAAEKRKKQLDGVKAYYQEKGITLPTQQIIFDRARFSAHLSTEKLVNAAERIIVFFNKWIKECTYLSLDAGRTFGVVGELAVRPLDLEGRHHQYTQEELRLIPTREELQQILSAFKASGHIFDFFHDRRVNGELVIC